MSDGEKRMIINTLERAVSTDIDRLQAFQATDRVESYRRLMNNPQLPSSGSTLNFGKLEIGQYVDTIGPDTMAIGTPLRGNVFEGLVVLPQVGSLSLLVSPGIVGVDDPDGQAGSSDPNPPSVDDSRYKVVVDPGILTLGVLLAVASGGGGIRIDVVEVRRKATVLEQQSRDIYNPVTGLFVPALVDKVDEGQLEYRVRTGTAGAGYPGNVQGWLPLCVIAVPNLAATVDQMTFWDVRPYVKDRVNAPFETEARTSSISPGIVTSDSNTNPLQTRLQGFVMNRLGAYLVGGQLKVGSTFWVDAQDPANQAAGYVPVASAIYYLYAVIPFDLPRWVRYQEFPDPRLPLGPRGILTITDDNPILDSLATKAIPLPTATGLGGGLQAGTLLLAGIVSLAAVPAMITVSGGLTLSAELIGGPAPTASTLAYDRYILLSGTHFPRSARWLRLTFSSAMSGPAALPFQYTPAVTMWNSAFTFSPALLPGSTWGAFLRLGGGPFSEIVRYSVWVPRHLDGVFEGYGNSNFALSIDWNPSGEVTARTFPLVAIAGWKLDE